MHPLLIVPVIKYAPFVVLIGGALAISLILAVARNSENEQAKNSDFKDLEPQKA